MATKVLVKECQYAEFKQSWQDEYLKWICAFANTEGGSLFVGVDDKGYVDFVYAGAYLGFRSCPWNFGEGVGSRSAKVVQGKGRRIATSR